MANKEIKTNAEIYREQRKARLEKAAKKKHSAKKDKAVRIIVKTVVALLCIGLIGTFAGNLLLNVFNVPQKLLPVATYNGEQITAAEYNYYYMYQYNNIYETAYQYENTYSQYYGSGAGAMLTGFDMSKDPAEQEYPFDDAPEGVKTWADYFREIATITAFSMKDLYAQATSDEAKADGFELTDDDVKEINEKIDEQIKTLEESAKQNQFSLDNFIARTCGEGLSEKTYREFLNKDLTVQKYLAWYQEHTLNGYTDEDVNAYFNENSANFLKVTARVFDVSYAELEEGSTDKAYTKAEAEKTANEFKAQITTEDKFISLAKQYAPESLKTQYESDDATLMKDATANDLNANEAVTNWLYSSERSIGDTAVIEDEEAQAFYVLYIVSPAVRDERVSNASVRHILIQAETTDASGNSLAADVVDKNMADAKAEAEKLMQKWKDNGATEDAFIALIADNTDDTASIQTDGLYDDVKPGGQYVAEFTNWAIDKERKPGDTGLVKTEFGYHFMYFVEASEYTVWENDVRTEMTNEAVTSLTSGLQEDIEEKVEINEFFHNYFADRLQETISSRF